jgi:hypothetical protein
MQNFTSSCNLLSIPDYWQNIDRGPTSTPNSCGPRPTLFPASRTRLGVLGNANGRSDRRYLRDQHWTHLPPQSARREQGRPLPSATKTRTDPNLLHRSLAVLKDLHARNGRACLADHHLHSPPSHVVVPAVRLGRRRSMVGISRLFAIALVKGRTKPRNGLCSAFSDYPTRIE